MSESGYDAATGRTLFVDVSVLARYDSGSGIQRVVRSLWHHLRHNSAPRWKVAAIAALEDHGFVLLPNDFLECDMPMQSELCKTPVISPGDLFLGLDLNPRLVWRNRKQLLQWRAQGLRFSFIVYDLLPLTHGYFFGWRNRFHFRRWFRFVSQNADQVICISRSVANVMKAMARHPAIAVLRLGSDGVRASDDGSMTHDMLRWLSERPTVMAVGTVEPRKNYGGLIAAFRWLWRNHPNDAPNLLCVGRPGWKTRQLQASMSRLREEEPRFRWVENAEDAELAQYYQLCSGLIAPSHAEGFGLPVAEALHAGVPVLARDIPVFRELTHPLLHFFVDDSPSVLGTGILVWIKNLAPFVSVGAEHMQTWEQTGNALLELLAIPPYVHRSPHPRLASG